MLPTHQRQQVGEARMKTVRVPAKCPTCGKAKMIPHKKYNQYCFDHIPLDKRCTVINLNGKRCRNPAVPGTILCVGHKKFAKTRSRRQSQVKRMQVGRMPGGRGPGYVYIVWLGRENFYKIGLTVDMDRRMEALKSSNPWVEERHCIPVINSAKIEKQLHRLFKKQCLEREIFFLSDEDIEQAVILLKQYEYTGELQ